MFPLRFAAIADPALHATAAVVGPQHVTLGLDPITWFGIFVALGVVIDELRRWRRRRPHPGGERSSPVMKKWASP